MKYLVVVMLWCPTWAWSMTFEMQKDQAQALWLITSGLRKAREYCMQGDAQRAFMQYKTTAADCIIFKETLPVEVHVVEQFENYFAQSERCAARLRIRYKGDV